MSIKNGIYKLSPSDFAYLWVECKHCFYQKVKYSVPQPGIFPSMFGRINGLLQKSIMGANLQEILPELPSAVVEIEEGFLRSKIVPNTVCYLSGRFDILSRLSDGSYAIIDFKITTPDEERIHKYASQLHAYKFALENPDTGKEPIKISSMGIVSINPEEMQLVNGKIVFITKPTWHPVKEDMGSFYNLVKEISSVLNGDLPQVSTTCNLCLYRKRFEPQVASITEDIPF